MLCSYSIISAFMNTTTLPICDKDSRSVWRYVEWFEGISPSAGSSREGNIRAQQKRNTVLA